MADGAVQLPRTSPLLWRFFCGIAARSIRRSFSTVRVLGADPSGVLDHDGPVVVYLNHPSWWDPLVCIHVARTLGRERHHAGPIAADALRRYPMFGRLGFYGIETGLEGARAFQRVSRASCEDPLRTLWITPEGRFTDVAKRPLELAPGLAHLARDLARDGVNARFLPMAVHYPFWDEKRPELLIAFGESMPASGFLEQPVAATNEQLRVALEQRLDELLEASKERDPEPFTVLGRGARSIHPVYEFWRRLRGIGPGHGVETR